MATSSAASAATDIIATAPPVDHAHLARYTFGNKALELEVLNLFANQAPLYLAGLRDARSEKDWRDAAHTLKGSARAVGALRVADLAERAEALKSSDDRAARAMAIDALAEALDEARQHIARLEVER